MTLFVVPDYVKQTIIFEKIKLFKKINLSSEEFEEKFWKSKSAETFYNNLPSNIQDPMALVFQNAMEGLLKKKSRSNISERMTALLENGIEKGDRVIIFSPKESIKAVEKLFSVAFGYF